MHFFSLYRYLPTIFMLNSEFLTATYTSKTWGRAVDILNSEDSALIKYVLKLQ